MEKVCSTCKHWGNQYSGSGRERRACCLILSSYDRPATSDLRKMVFVGADDDYSLMFETGPTFGCKLWEKRTSV